MIKFKFHSDFDPDEIGRQIRKSAIERVEGAISQVVCPIHGQTATCHVVDEHSDNIRFEFSGCCETLIEKCYEAVRFES